MLAAFLFLPYKRSSFVVLDCKSLSAPNIICIIPVKAQILLGMKPGEHPS